MTQIIGSNYGSISLSGKNNLARVTVLFVNAKASGKIGAIRFSFEMGILLCSNGSEVIFSPSRRGARQAVVNGTNGRP